MVPSKGTIWRSGRQRSSPLPAMPQRIRMLSGLPGRPGLAAIRMGFNDTFRLVVRVTEFVGLSAAVWTGAASGGAYLAITAWQAELSWLFFWIMQAVVRARSGIVAEQTRKASFMQACCSSADCAYAAVDRALTVRAIASVSRMGNPLFVMGISTVHPLVLALAKASATASPMRSRREG